MSFVIAHRRCGVYHSFMVRSVAIEVVVVVGLVAVVAIGMEFVVVVVVLKLQYVVTI